MLLHVLEDGRTGQKDIMELLLHSKNLVSTSGNLLHAACKKMGKRTRSWACHWSPLGEVGASLPTHQWSLAPEEGSTVGNQLEVSTFSSRRANSTLIISASAPLTEEGSQVPPLDKCRDGSCRPHRGPPEVHVLLSHLYLWPTVRSRSMKFL